MLMRFYANFMRFYFVKRFDEKKIKVLTIVNKNNQLGMRLNLK